jgi:cellulose synthase/poly-beta-1,6-N-acetylglucosamine synthase-like glycosyltransferase
MSFETENINDSGARPVSNSDVPLADAAAPHLFLKLLFSLCLLGYLTWAILQPRAAFKGLFASAAWLSVVYALFRMAAILTAKPQDYGLKSLSDDLPIYTVLVPLFHESQMIPQLLDGLETLNYPREKLDIVLITEAVDPLTTATVTSALRPPFRQVIVPRGKPQTKPRALNYALQSSLGEFVTIYDAEDRPHPDQLLAALAAFDARPDWAAVQAPLEYFNHGDNWLTRQFALEYAALFHVWVPFLVRMGLPFPLGGTSNHMRRAPLDMIGGWDAHNVTEDADLSFRLAAQGHSLGYIHPPTQEEAICILKDWRLQRARWMKGFIQTWAVHMSRPLTPGGAAGTKRFFTLQLTLGLTVISVLFYTPVVLGLPLFAAVLWWVQVPLDIGLAYSLTFVFSIAIGCLIGIAGAHRAGLSRLIRAAHMMPLYWLLLFEPAIRAFSELKHKRFHWHKTRHGVSRPAELTPPPLAEPNYVPLRRFAD